MLKIEINKLGQIFISGDKVDLRDLRYQIDEVLDHDMPFTKTYQDFRHDAWEKKEEPKTVTVKIS